MKYFLIKFKGALITTVIFIILLGFIFFRNSEKDVQVASDNSFSFVVDDEVLSVEIYYPKFLVLLENEGEEWFIIQDEQKLNADQKLVNNLIQEIRATNIVGYVPIDEVDLDQFGLENAKAELVVNTEEKEHRFIVGDKIPVGSGTYVYVPDEKLVLVVEKDYLNEFVKLSSIDFRDKGLFDFDSNRVTRIAIWSGNFSVDIFKEEGEWYVEGEDEILVDDKKVDELLWVFSRAKVLEFENESPESLKKYGLDEPTTEIRFYEDNQIQGVVFGKRKDEDSYYIQSDSSDAVYSIHKSLFKRVPKSIDQITLK
ncbi:MAG: DUF4340 domain-containing protein [Thermodesulfobacteriales bacterium]|jgi:hypothetical protein|nr:MAG: DUF4340 domain-containing protein [Thermodesulfobacteriales bacterium]